MSKTASGFKARPTVYKGIQMRSRLEARFAASLDRHGFVWSYEPECFADAAGQYLPDFKIIEYPGTFDVSHPVFIEVKPTLSAAIAAVHKQSIIRSSLPDANLDVFWPIGDNWGWLHQADDGSVQVAEKDGRPREMPGAPIRGVSM